MSKEEIKQMAEQFASLLGYNINSISLEVINVKEAFCHGFKHGEEDKIAYAKATAIAFERWRFDSDIDWYEGEDGEIVYYFIYSMQHAEKCYNQEQLYNLFIEHQSKQ